MRARFQFVIFVFAMILGLSAQMAVADLEVAEGWDLFQTETAFFDFGGPIGKQAFEGVPLGTFDFGGTIGVQNTGQTDTIVRRLAPAVVLANGDTDTIAIEMVALSLVSVNPINIGSGPELLDATLSMDNGSMMSITFDDMFGGTFSSILDFEVKFTGQTSGDMMFIDKVFTTTDQPWQRDPTGNVIIDDVNHFLKGDMTEDQDFWPVGLITHDDGAGTTHNTISSVPEPSAVAFGTVVLSAVLVGSVIRRYLSRENYVRRSPGPVV